MKNAPDNRQSVIDSRDIMRRIEELESDLESAYDEHQDEETGITADADPDRFKQWVGNVAQDNDHELQEDANELMILRKLADEGENNASDWQHGATLIRDSYFEQYARELANDIGAVKDTDQWPLTCISWEKAAEELQQDYSSIDFDGVEYWVRS